MAIRKILRIAAMALAVLVVLVILAAVVGTRSFFLTGVVLPRVGAAVGIPIRAEKIVLRPFSRIEIQQLRIGPDAEPLFVGEQVRCRYNLRRILAGDIRVHELLVRDGTLTLTQQADGAWNLPLPRDTKPRETTPSAPAPTTGPDTGVQLHLTDVKLENFQILLHQAARPDQAEPIRIEVDAIQLEIPELQNGGEAKLVLAATIRDTVAGSIRLEHAKVEAEWELRLDQNLVPEHVAGTLAVHMVTGHVGTIALANRSLAVTAVAERSQDTWRIASLRVEETSAGTPELGIEVSGTLTPAPLRAELDWTVDPVSASFLNLIGQLAGGYEFGSTTFAYTGTLNPTPEQEFELHGRLQARKMTVRTPGATAAAIAPTDFDLTHALIVSRAKADGASAPANVTGNVTLDNVRIQASNGEMRPVMNAELRLDAGLDANTLTFRDLKLTGTRQGTAFLDLSVEGTVALPVARGPSRLNLQSEQLDLNVIDALLALPTAQSPEPAPGPAPLPLPPGAPAPASEEPGPVNLQGLDLVATFAVADVRYREIRGRDWKGTVTVRDNVAEVDPFTLVLNRAPLAWSSTVDFGTPGFTYKFRGSLENLDFQPLLRSFAPDVDQWLKGRLANMRLEGRGAGVTLPNLKKKFEGTLQLDLDALSLVRLPALEQLAAQWGIDELRDVTFRTGRVRASAENGLATISELGLGGSDLAPNGNGAIDFDRNLKLSCQVAVGGRLLRALRARLGSETDTETDELVTLPVPLAVSGTLSEPKTEWRGLSAASLLQFGAAVLGKTLQTDDDSPAGLHNLGLRELLRQTRDDTPEQPEPETAPTPPPATDEPAAEAASEQTEDERRHEQNKARREKRRDALEQLGGALLNSILKPK